MINNLKFSIKKIKTFFKYSFILVFFLILIIISLDFFVEKKTDDKIFDSVSEISHNKVGLLLGTIKVLKNGRLNLYYQYRIDACVELYKAGKIDFVLISGDNSRKEYDEPTEMKNDLISKGIPQEKIYLDYAGFRTLDSVIRCKEVFGEEHITIISQEFHNQRALMIAEFNSIEALAFNAQDVNAPYGLKTQIRERFARIKMMLDLIFGKEPKFLGKKISIQNK